MRVIAVVCQKGGSGKTTTATELAVLATKRGYQTLVFDVDPQASAALWADDRGGDPPQVVPAQAPRLGPMLASAEKQGAEMVFVDTGPAADNAALAAARVADVILVPAKCTVRDLQALKPTLRTVMDVIPHARMHVVLSMVPIRGAVVGEAERFLAEAGVKVCPVRLHQRAAFYNGLGAGRASTEWEPSGKAATEASALWAWLCGELGMSPVAGAKRVKVRS